MMKLESSDKLFMGKMSCLFALLLMGFISGRTSFNSSHNQPVNVVQKIEKKNAVSYTGNKSDVPVTLIR